MADQTQTLSYFPYPPRTELPLCSVAATVFRRFWLLLQAFCGVGATPLLFRLRRPSFAQRPFLPFCVQPRPYGLAPPSGEPPCPRFRRLSPHCVTLKGFCSAPTHSLSVGLPLLSLQCFSLRIFFALRGGMPPPSSRRFSGEKSRKPLRLYLTPFLVPNFPTKTTVFEPFFLRGFSGSESSGFPFLPTGGMDYFCPPLFLLRLGPFSPAAVFPPPGFLLRGLSFPLRRFATNPILFSLPVPLASLLCWLLPIFLALRSLSSASTPPFCFFALSRFFFRLVRNKFSAGGDSFYSHVFG